MTVRRIERIYFTAEFLTWLAVALPLPLSVLLMQARGLDLFQIGLLSALYSLTIVVLELPTGGLADAVGRKPVTLLSYGVTLSSSLVFLVAFSFPTFAVAFVLMGVSRALASGALSAWFVDSLLDADPEIDLQPPLAKAGSAVILGLSLGTLAGGFVPELFASLPPDGSAVLTPLSMTIVFAVAVKAVGAVVVLAAVEEDRTRFGADDATTGLAGPPAGLAGLLAGLAGLPAILGDALAQSRRNPTLLLLLAAAFCGALALMSVETFWQPRFAEWLGRDSSVSFGLIMTGAFLVGVVGNLVSIPLARLLGRRYGLTAALAQGLAGVAVLGLAQQTGLLGATAWFWLYYFWNAVLGSPVGAIFNGEVPSRRRSSMQSVLSLVGYAGSVAGSLVLGYLAEHDSIATAWAIAGGVLLLSSLLYLRIDARRAPRGALGR